MQYRQIGFALSFLSLSALTSVPARAATPATTSRFSLTFPAGWQALPVQTGGDSVMAVFSPTLMAYCYMTSTTTDHAPTAQELDAYLRASGGADSVTKVTDGTKTLGGKSFTFVEYESADTSGDSSRVRMYYTSSGSNFFSAILIYDPATGSGAVSDLETALATLTLSGTPIRAWAARSLPGIRAADHDILGRSRLPSARTALFRLPLP
jgi:hypothetical protein